MNAIQTRDRIDFYNDLTRVARFYPSDIDKAVNDAIVIAVQSRMENQDKPYNFDVIQKIRTDLQTLIKDSSLTCVDGTAITTTLGSFIPTAATNPTDFYQFIGIRTTISGITTYARPTEYNQLMPLLEDTYRKPSNSKTYYLENSTGYTIYRGNSGTITAVMTYIKTPNTFTIGNETQWVSTGGTLTNAASYIALETSVYAGTTYQSGATITGTGAALTSGKVILASNTTPIDLPAEMHEQIAKMASDILMKSIGEYPKAQAIESEINKIKPS